MHLNVSFFIDSRELYDYAVSRGFEPLVDRRFNLEHSIRLEAQRQKFGTGNHEENNIRFYRWVWDHKRHVCEECMKPLREYSATYVSHIVSRGHAPELAYDPRNTNILCFNCHSRWENGDRMNMRIYLSNRMTIQELRKEYETNKI